MVRIFFDMDGVLAKWQNASIEDVASKGYFSSLEPQENVTDAVRILSRDERLELYVLSSVFSDNHSVKEKRDWNKRFVPDVPAARQIYVPYGMAKAEGLSAIGGIRPNDVLIDDFSENLHKWRGIGVKLYNGINGTKGTWDRYSVHASMKPEYLANQLRAIALLDRYVYFSIN